MNLKRFVQLFICYFVSMVVAVLLTNLFNIFNYAILFVGGLYYWVYHINDPVSSHDDQEKQIVPRVDLLKGASDDWQCSLSTKKVKKMVHSLSYLSDTYLWLVVVY